MIPYPQHRNSHGITEVKYEIIHKKFIVTDEWQICSFIDIGMSTDNYTGNTDRERQSYRYANKFYDGLVLSHSGPITKTHHFNNGSNHTASKNDFSVNGAISNNIDFMIYIGHGHVAHDLKGNHIQYSYSTIGETNTTNVCGNSSYSAEYIDSYCSYTSEMTFGSSTSDLRWVWLYTCNFLTPNNYVTDISLKDMMTGAHIVMGYASQSYLCDAMSTKFAEYLYHGEPIIDAYFMAGYWGEATATNSHHLQKVLYIPQARYETIYSPQVHYDYTSTNVLTITHNIQDGYNS